MIVVTSVLYRNRLYDIASEMWPMGDDDTRQQMSVMATSAAWGLNQWDGMEEYVRCIPRESFDGAFYQALLNIHNHSFVEAQKVGQLLLLCVSRCMMQC